jgi:hypothetical protein
MVASKGKMSKDEYVTRIIECESRAAEKTRAFYINIFMYWAKENHLSSNPQIWFLAWRQDPHKNIFFGHVTKKHDYWRAYERQYDLICL